MNAEKILEVKNLSVQYDNNAEYVFQDFSFDLFKSEILCLQGRSGTGKSTIMAAILGMLPDYNARGEGEILYKGKNLLTCDEKDMGRIRWREISLVPQASMNSFNPVYTMRQTLREMLLLENKNLDDAQCRLREEELMDMVHLDKSVLNSYPHELSGGMKQRAAIALGIIYHPDILILDEVTTGLDIKMQADVLGTILGMKKREGTTILFISHDAELGNQFCDRKVELL